MEERPLQRCDEEAQRRARESGRLHNLEVVERLLHLRRGLQCPHPGHGCGCRGCGGGALCWW